MMHPWFSSDYKVIVIFSLIKMGIDYIHVNKSVHTLMMYRSAKVQTFRKPAHMLLHKIFHTWHKYNYSKLLLFLLHYILPCISTFIVIPPPAVKYYCCRYKITLEGATIIQSHITNMYVFSFAKQIIMYIVVYIYHHTTI